MKSYQIYQQKIKETSEAKEAFLKELQIFIVTNFGTMAKPKEAPLRNCVGTHIRQKYGINVEDVAIVLNKPYGTVSTGLIGISYDLLKNKNRAIEEMEKVKGIFNEK